MKEKKNKPSSDVIFSGNTVHPVLASIGATSIAEILTSIITPALLARKAEWMETIGDQLKTLEEQNKVVLKDLSTNPQFIDTVVQATSYSLKTSDQEKMLIFKKVIANAALGEVPDQTHSQIFLNLIDRFTIWHIKILKLFDNPREWYKINGKQPPSFMAGSLLGLLTDAFPELRGQEELMDLIWSDLHAAGFHRTTTLRTTMTGDGVLAERTTAFGKKFLDFISTHE